jgi:hypothetical protein
MATLNLAPRAARHAPSLSQAPAQSAHPASIGDLEGPAYNAAAMAGILCDMVEALVTQQPPVRFGEYHLFCDETARAKLSYAAHEVSEITAALKQQFYSIYSAELEGKREAAEPDALDTGRNAARWLPFDPVTFLNIALQCRAPVTLAPQAVTFHEPEGQSEAYEFIRGWRNATEDATAGISKTLQKRAALRNAHLQLAKSIARGSRGVKKGGVA